MLERVRESSFKHRLTSWPSNGRASSEQSVLKGVLSTRISFHTPAIFVCWMHIPKKLVWRQKKLVWGKDDWILPFWWAEWANRTATGHYKHDNWTSKAWNTMLFWRLKNPTYFARICFKLTATASTTLVIPKGIPARRALPHIPAAFQPNTIEKQQNHQTSVSPRGDKQEQSSKKALTFYLGQNYLVFWKHPNYVFWLLPGSVMCHRCPPAQALPRSLQTAAPDSVRVPTARRRARTVPQERDSQQAPVSQGPERDLSWNTKSGC